MFKKKNIKIFTFCLFLFSVTSLNAQQFPHMLGHSLNGKSINLPIKSSKDVFKTGRPTFVALAHSQKSDAYLKEWRRELFDLFIQAPSTDLFSFEPYDANLAFVVLLTGVQKAAGKKVESKLKENITDTKWKSHILIVKGKTLSDYPVLQLNRKEDVPHFYLMDKNGKIVYMTSGHYTKQKGQELQDKLDALIGSNQFKD